ncbi:MAG: hypothetical protein IPK73_31130 [Candidatus Obscuribacter sp.]|nr:hypothetical protein [Candidatus Obscuribacter sp.]MBK9281483.1 hypothetical protein [Candidatus Obscuribacter sp.]
MKNSQLIIVLGLLGVCVNAEAKPGFETVQVIKHARYPRSEWPAGSYCAPHTYACGGLFFELEDGQVCFFTSSQYKRFRAALQDGTSKASEKILFWNPKTRKSKTVLASIEFQGSDHISVNGSPVMAKSMERLRLTKDWEKISKKAWPVGCSAVNLGEGKFLITGGMNDDDASGWLYLSRAVVYNSTTDSIEKEFKMFQGRAYHSAVLLPNKTVFCVGGLAMSDSGPTYATDSAEIIDVQNNKIISVPAKLPVGLVDTTICKDLEGNPIIWGGLPLTLTGFSSARIFRYELASGRFVQAGSLKTGRHFGRAARVSAKKGEPKLTEVTEDCAERLSSGQYVIDGGVYIQASPIADSASGHRDTAEVVQFRAN